MQHPQMALPAAVTGLVAAQVVVQLWRWAELRDPALVGGDSGYGPRWAVDAYAGWPHTNVTAKAAYLARHLPALCLLMAHHWGPPDVWSLAWVTALFAAALAAGRCMRLPADGGRLIMSVMCCGCLCLEVGRLVTCAAPAAGVACADFSRSSLWQCPPCGQAELLLQMMEPLMTWKAALGIALHFLPLPAYPVGWLCCTAVVALLYARYGTPTPDQPWPLHAAQPLRLRELARVVASPPLLTRSGSFLARMVVMRLTVTVLLPRLSRALGARARRRGAAATKAGDVCALRAASAASGSRNGGGCGSINVLASGGSASAAAPPGSAAPSPGVVAPPARAHAPSIAAPRPHGSVRRAGAYSTSLARERAALLIKTEAAQSPAGGHAASHAMLARCVPPAVTAALQAAGGHLPTGPPMVLYRVCFPGCFAELVQVAPWPLPGGQGAAAVATALAALLPPEAQLLGVEDAPVALPVAEAAWLDPVVLPLGGGNEGVTVVLPPSLVAALQGAGCGLRVVVSSPSRSHPALDVTLRPGEDRWPADGRLELVLPAGVGPVLVISLMRASADGAGGAAGVAGTYVTALPLLVLPAAAAAELLDLWHDVTQYWAAQLPGASAAQVAGAAYGAELAPFAHDLAAVLQHGPVGPLEGPANALLGYLEACNMDACTELVLGGWHGPGDDVAAKDAAEAPDAAGRTASGGADASSAGMEATDGGGARAASAGISGGGAVEAAVAARVGASGPSPSACASQAAKGARAPAGSRSLSLRARLADEREYQRWKAAQLQPHDRWVCVSVLLMTGMLVVLAAARRSSALIMQCVLVQTAMALLPAAACVCARRAYRAWRGVWWLASAVLHAAYMHHVLLRFPPEELVQLSGLMERPIMMALSLHTLYPFLHQLSLVEQGVASLAQSYDTYLLYEITPGADHLPPAAFLALPACAVLIAAVSDWRMRRQWRQVLAAGGGSRVAPAPGAAAQMGGKGAQP